MKLGTTKNVTRRTAATVLSRSAPRRDVAVAGELRQRAAATAHREQADRQQIQRLRIAQPCDGANREQAREHEIEIARSWTTPRPMIAGPALRTASLNAGSLRPVESEFPGRGAARPAAAPELQRAAEQRPRGRDARARRARRASRTRRGAPMIAAFHSTGAEYERKNRRWLLQDAERTTPTSRARASSGNRIRTRSTVISSARGGPSKPGASSSTSRSAASTPRRAAIALAIASSEQRADQAPATREACVTGPGRGAPRTRG